MLEFKFQILHTHIQIMFFNKPQHEEGRERKVGGGNLREFFSCRIESSWRSKSSTAFFWERNPDDEECL